MMNKHEMIGWLRLAAFASAFAYLCWKLLGADVLVREDGWQGIRESMLILFYALVFAVLLVKRRVAGVIDDERDRAISALAARMGLVALTLIVLVSAMLIGTLGYAHLLTTRSGEWFEHYLMACLALGWSVESSVCVFHHWRDRR